MDKYPASDFLPNIAIHNTLSICGRMASWRTRDPRWVLRLSSGWFSCGFNIVDRLGLLYETSQVLGLRGRWGLLSSGSRLKGQGTHNIQISLLKIPKINPER